MKEKKYVVKNEQVRTLLWTLNLIGECVDCKEGSLLDSAIYDTGDYLVVLIERFETCWTSGYDMYVANKRTEVGMSEAERAWELYCDWYEKEFGKEE